MTAPAGHSTSRPLAFVLVPGASCLPTHYELVGPKLTALGHSVHAIHLPSVGRDRTLSDNGEGPASAYDDIAYINRVCTDFCDSGHNVVLVGNSYGGFVITQACQGLSRADRDSAGKDGGCIVALVYLASLLPPLGVTVHELVGHLQPVDTSANVTYIDPIPAEIAGPILCSELSSLEEQIKYGGMLDVHSVRSYHDKLSYAGYEHFPTTFVVAGRDKTISATHQIESVDGVIGKGFGNVRKVVVESDHLMMVSCSEEVVKILVEAGNAGALGTL